MKRQAYPSDMTDTEWAILEPSIPLPNPGGRQREVDMREILNSVFYILRSGCAWRMMPHDLPPWQTSYGYFNRWRKDGLWERLNDALRARVRQAEGREPEPSAALIDSQSVKATAVKGIRGFDGGKQVRGRKRHILVDTLGFLLVVLVHSAGLSEQAGGKLLLQRAYQKGFAHLRLIWADGGYRGQPMIDWVYHLAGWLFTVVKRTEQGPGFLLLPRRWVVERTFAWLCHYRRLSKEYEVLTATSESLIYAAMVHLMVRRLARHRVL
jgi:putative transposase